MFGMLKKSAVGIDIADHTVEVVKVRRRGRHVKLVSAGRQVLPAGIVQRGRVRDGGRLREEIERVLAQAQPKPIELANVQVGLPESQTYLYVFTATAEKLKQAGDELAKVVDSELATAVPVSPAELVTAHTVLKSTGSEVTVLAAAAERAVVAEWFSFFESIGVVAEGFDVESLAIYRGLFPYGRTQPVCLVDLGAVTTTVAIFDEQGLRLSGSVPVAGEVLTQAVARALAMPLPGAEATKRKAGLADSRQPVYAVLTGELVKVLKEIKAALRFYHSKEGSHVTEIVLVGGSSRMPGLAQWLFDQLGVMVVLGASPLHQDSTAPFYAGAVGLALRGVMKRWQEKDPLLLGEHATTSEPVKPVSVRPSSPPVLKKIGELPSAKAVAEVTTFKRQKVVLVGVLVVGLVLLGMAYWFREQERGSLKAQLPTQHVYSEVQTFEVAVPVAVNEDEYTEDRVRGRRLSEFVLTAESYTEAVVIARTVIEKQVEEGETLWSTPLTKEQEVFPMTIEWLVYDEPGLNRLADEQAAAVIGGRVEYSLSNIEKQRVEVTVNPNVYLFYSEVTVALNEPVEIPETNETSEVESEQTLVVTQEYPRRQVVDAPEGLADVYGEADLAAPVLTQAREGDWYSVISQREGWYQIQIAEKALGWIEGRYLRPYEGGEGSPPS